jgi:predicted small lipoprotein YifL
LLNPLGKWLVIFFKRNVAMKKFFSLFMIAVMAVSFVGCGGKPADKKPEEKPATEKKPEEKPAEMK